MFSVLGIRFLSPNRQSNHGDLPPCPMAQSSVVTGSSCYCAVLVSIAATRMQCEADRI